LPQGNGRIDDFVVENDFPRVGRKNLVVNARWFRGSSSDREQLLLLAVDEAVDRKKEEMPASPA
jgi:hypothetical protein